MTAHRLMCGHVTVTLYKGIIIIIIIITIIIIMIIIIIIIIFIDFCIMVLALWLLGHRI